MLFEMLMLGSVPLRTDRHRLAGSVVVDGSPAKRLVVALDRTNFSVVASTWSDQATGAWEMSGLPEYDEGRLLVVAIDRTGQYNAEAADYISQVTGN